MTRKTPHQWKIDEQAIDDHIQRQKDEEKIRIMNRAQEMGISDNLVLARYIERLEYRIMRLEDKSDR